ncbi:MAG: metallophosphoesterase [Candidatus Dadabacteria bacterium]|nr:MAG: metallophosphoesterase [Candidatus Dadabacteria bacterium]
MRSLIYIRFQVKVSRRTFLKLSAPALLAGCSSLSYPSNLASPEITDTSLPIPEIPKEFVGYKIAFIADTHLGIYLTKDYLWEIFSKTKKLRPDLLVLGGDYIWIQRSQLAKAISSITKNSLSGLSRGNLITEVYNTTAKGASEVNPPDGICAVYGNHDRWEAPVTCKESLERSGIRVLVNDSYKIRRGSAELTIYGCDDYWTGIPKLSLPLKKEKNEIRIVLAHNPDYLAENANKLNELRVYLALCGHTHGGQIRFPLVGPFFYNISHRDLIEGLNYLGETAIYTTRGIGTVEIPLRVNCPPEITFITLV